MAPKKGTKRVTKVRAPLDMSQISFGRVEPGLDMRMARPTRGVREAEQQAIDELVMAAWDAWKIQGSPESWEDTPGQLITVPTQLKTVDGKEVDEILDTVMWRVRRAGQHFSFKIRFGDITREDGYSHVVFIATDKPAGDTSEDESDEDAEAREDESDEGYVPSEDEQQSQTEPAWS